MLRVFSVSDRLLSMRLGLGDLSAYTPACHGYQNGCRCADCKERATKPLPAPSPVKQPWDIAA